MKNIKPERLTREENCNQIPKLSKDNEPRRLTTGKTRIIWHGDERQKM